MGAGGEYLWRCCSTFEAVDEEVHLSVSEVLHLTNVHAMVIHLQDA